MPESQFTPDTLLASLFAFPDGMNSGVQPLLLPPTQAAFATNATFRGTFIKPRPPWFRYTLDFGGDAALQLAVTKALWQGACYYKPDTGAETLVAQIGGRLFQFTPNPATRTATVRDITVPLDPNSAVLTQAWLWQSEKYVLVNNGVAKTIIFDGVTSRRSNASQLQQVTQNGKLAVSLSLNQPIGATGIAITLTSNFTGVNGDVLIVGNNAQFLVTAGAGTPNLTVTNLNVKPTLNLGAAIVGGVQTPAFSGVYFPAGTPVTFFTQSTTIGELPPGRMGVYLMGRNWVCLVDGKQFVASDQVGGSSGTVAENFRDAVLKISENSYLAGGGNFTVPGSVGDIRAMTFVAELDAALGQGPLMVFTTRNVFSCKSPVLRTEWQDVTNPILRVALISEGATGQNSTIQSNGDTIFRSLVGIFSLILARRDFDTWGNVPISREVERVTDLDDEALLPFASAIVFDNRMLMTTRPTSSSLGVYHQGLVALNFDPLSTLRGKAPSIYDGVWAGLNALQLLTGEFSLVERAFAFTFNTTTTEIELWELEKTKTTEINDNTFTPITWLFESPTLDWPGEKRDKPRFKRMMDGEIYVDDLRGSVLFQAFYRPDEWPCWIPWLEWTECAGTGTGTQPQFRPRMGLGQPDSKLCDLITNRPFRDAYRFQFKLVVTGHCRFLGARFKAVTLPEPTFSKPKCA